MNTDKTSFQAELLANRLTKRYKHLLKWARRTGTNAYRLYDNDIPEIPLVLDLYDNAVSGALYKRPYEKSEEEEEIWLNAMKVSIAGSLHIPIDHIFLKERRRMKARQNTGSQYGKIAKHNFYRDVHEGDLKFRVNLSDYLDTGLYLDVRKKRALIQSEAAGKKVLNLFAYTSTLSVSAAKGGALEVDSVDLSAPYLEWGKVNFALNGLTASLIDGKDFLWAKNHNNFRSIRSDVLLFLQQAKRAGAVWDLILLDPPSFSNSKKMNGTIDIWRDHRELIRKCLSLLSAGGTLWFSSNAKGFSLAAEDFPDLIVKDRGAELMDEDFRGKRIPACYTLARQE